MSGPIVGKRRLRAELRQLRLDRGLTQDQVATDMEWSLSKLIRIENGTVAISVSDLRSLLSYYGVHEQHRIDGLLELARAAKRRMWWDEYRNELSNQLLTFVGFETEASQISCFHPIQLPGLVQTEAYANALHAGFGPDPDPKEVARKTEFRMRRQDELFNRPDPPRFVAVLDESVLRRRPDANDQTMREQLAHLVEFAQRPYASIHVLPFTAGYHRGWDGNFTIIEFGDEDEVLYAQNNPSGEVILWEEQDTIDEFRGLMGSLVERALGREDSIGFIQKVRDETH